MTSFDLRPAADAKSPVVVAPAAQLDRVTAVLRTRRAAFVFAAIVCVATLVQVLVNPLAGVLSEGATWQHPLGLPVAVVVILVTIGCCAQSAALLWSGRRPVVALLVTLTIYLLLVVVAAVPNWMSAMQLVVAIALFLLGAARSTRTTLSWWAAATALYIGVTLAWTVALGTKVEIALAFVLGQSVGFVAITAGAAALGLWWGEQSRRANRARDEAEAAAHAYETQVAIAREVERDRIAQELHDVAAQHLAGLIALSDGALAIAATQPQAALRLVEEVRAEGHFAAASLYGALADLSAVGGEPNGATRDLRRVAELVEFWRRRGTPVELQVAGRLDDLPAVVSTTGFRCVQEALTNAAKHAPGAAVRVEIDAAPNHLSIAVENDAPPTRGTPAPGIGLGLGWGLSGLRERVGLLDGTLFAASTDEGGFRVQMRVPTVDFGHAVSGANR